MYLLYMLCFYAVFLGNPLLHTVPSYKHYDPWHYIYSVIIIYTVHYCMFLSQRVVKMIRFVLLQACIYMYTHTHNRLGCSIFRPLCESIYSRMY